MTDSVIHHLGIGLVEPRIAAEYFDRLFIGYLGLEREETSEAVTGWKGRGTRIYLYALRGAWRAATLGVHGAHPR